MKNFIAIVILAALACAPAFAKSKKYVNNNADCVDCPMAVGMAGAARLEAKQAQATANEAKDLADQALIEVKQTSMESAEVAKEAIGTTVPSLQILVPDAPEASDDNNPSNGGYRCPGAEKIRVRPGKEYKYSCTPPEGKNNGSAYSSLPQYTPTVTSVAVEEENDASQGNTWLALGAGVAVMAVSTVIGGFAGNSLGVLMDPPSLTIAEPGDGSVDVDYHAGGIDQYTVLGASAGAFVGLGFGLGAAALVYSSGFGSE